MSLFLESIIAMISGNEQLVEDLEIKDIISEEQEDVNGENSEEQ